MNKSAIIALARNDYRPDLVAVDDALIDQTPLPKKSLFLLPSGLAPVWNDQPASAIAFFIALNAINFMFWEKTGVPGAAGLKRYRRGESIGAIGMREGFDTLWNDVPDVAYVREKIGGRGAVITPQAVVQYFGDIPAPAARAEILQDIFRDRVLEQVSAAVLERVQATGALTVEDAHLLHEAFSRAYADPYYKRSQLALTWIAGYFAERGIDVDVSGMTGFSDYQVPKVMRAKQFLKYGEQTAAAVDHLELIPADSPMERAIRAATILGIERLAACSGVSAGHVDNFLWSNRNAAGDAPFHLTITEAY